MFLTNIRFRKSGIAGALIPLVCWFLAKQFLNVSDRYIPGINDVAEVVFSNQLDIWLHVLVSFLRIVSSFIFAVSFSVLVGCFLFKYKRCGELVIPILHGLRAVPAPAMVPFFILWFGFSEWGRFLVFVLGISTNLIISVVQILASIREKYQIFFHSFGLARRNLPYKILVPFALDGLLPTIRFSLTVLMGLSVVAELIGAQMGLGYLMQSARTTYSLDVIFACAFLYAAIAFILDLTCVRLWKVLTPWTYWEE